MARRPGVCARCHREGLIYRAGACRPCDTRLHADPTKPPGKVEPVGPRALPMRAPTLCRVCRRPAPLAGMCRRCVDVAAYQPPPVPYYPVVR